MNKAIELLSHREKELLGELADIQGAIKKISNGYLPTDTSTMPFSFKNLTVIEAAVKVLEAQSPGTRMPGKEIWKHGKGMTSAKRISFLTGIAREAGKSDGKLKSDAPGEFSLRK